MKKHFYLQGLDIKKIGRTRIFLGRENEDNVITDEILFWLAFLPSCSKLNIVFPIIEQIYKLENLNPKTVSEFYEFEPWLKSAKNRFQLSAGLNLEKLNTIFIGTNNIWAAA